MNTIFSAAAGYQPDDLGPFLASARQHLRDFEMVLLIAPGDEVVLEPLRQNFPFLRFAFLHRGTPWKRLRCWITHVALPGARILRRLDRHGLGDRRRQALECGMNPALSRYFLIERLLNQPGASSGGRVMLADSRDLVFQADAFVEIPGPLVTGAEPIFNQPDDRWIGLVYGPSGQARLAGKQVYCSGFTIGDRDSVRAYVGKVCDQMWAHLPAMLFHRGLDQAIHIRLLHDRLLAATIVQNADGKIATISQEPATHLQIDRDAGAVRVCGSIPPVLHQYDRHPALRDFVRSLYPGSPIPSATSR